MTPRARAAGLLLLATPLVSYSYLAVPAGHRPIGQALTVGAAFSLVIAALWLAGSLRGARLDPLLILAALAVYGFYVGMSGIPMSESRYDAGTHALHWLYLAALILWLLAPVPSDRWETAFLSFLAITQAVWIIPEHFTVNFVAADALANGAVWGVDASKITAFRVGEIGRLSVAVLVAALTGSLYLWHRAMANGSGR